MIVYCKKKIKNAEGRKRNGGGGRRVNC